MGSRPQHFALAVVLVAACGAEPGKDPLDAVASVDSFATSDSGAPADADHRDAVVTTSTDARACDYGRTRTIPPDGPIGVGTFCDDLYVCIETREVGEAVAAIAPNFACRQGAPRFDCPGVVCAWQATPQGGSPGSIDTDELDQVCALTLLPALESDVFCVVYL